MSMKKEIEVLKLIEEKVKSRSFLDFQDVNDVKLDIPYARAFNHCVHALKNLDAFSKKDNRESLKSCIEDSAKYLEGVCTSLLLSFWKEADQSEDYIEDAESSDSEEEEDE